MTEAQSSAAQTPGGRARGARLPARRALVVGGGIVGVVALLAAGISACGGDGSTPTRQEAVAERGAEVMPFDLEATTHHFDPVDDGLVQTVVADDPDDAEQVSLVRQHLAAEAEAFARGDYGDPTRIHGEDMPGLAEPEAGAGDIEVAYEPTAGGARITYATSRPDLVDALRSWAEAQTTDHGTHAT